jgi:hypothetical protein|tara:strand:- start:1288 stop:1524 length:237 start_codon:yes stop_codon:yes gene_type:complete
MNKEKIKLSLKGYAKVTPVKYQKLGDALLSVSSMITGYAVVDEIKWLALVSLAIGVAGKFLTNFFADADGDGIIDIEQ